MTDTSSQFKSIAISVILVASVIVSAVGVGAGVAAAKSGDITATSLTNTIDQDSDGNVSDFDISVTADTTLEDWDSTLNPADPAGEPRFRIQMTGEIDGVIETRELLISDEKSRGTEQEFILSVPQTEIQQFDRGSHTLSVELLDDDGTHLSSYLRRSVRGVV